MLQHALAEENWMNQNRSLVHMLQQLDDENESLFNEIAECALLNAETLYTLLQERLNLLNSEELTKLHERDTTQFNKQFEIQNGYVQQSKMLIDEGGESVEDFLNVLYHINRKSSSLFTSFVESLTEK